MKAWIAAVSLWTIVVSGTVSAAASDGNQLITACQAVVKYMDGNKNTDSYDFGYCIGIVEATEGSLMILNDVLPKQFKTCYPTTGTTNGQKARIVVKFLQENPAMLNQPATYLAMYAYKAAYPCQ
ncbi:hypothetical protein SAMN05444064_10219 [Pseudomonas syringae]|uniref:Rap1a/Tai family immunity protein n=1 Tax=Pseudomonas syringae TaxID=317 RepID=UPI00089750A5|nr:Rap1a/Tai family immunity protein [Pseudomonas syringae]SDW30438.1 hypothetical protein SAMN05444514_102391 [Pseudomonas syringae]SFL49966.1 hypothetical protein SAMN05444064_10219 [Pseudomonas syringae]